MPPDRRKSEHTGKFGYFPLARTNVQRGLERVTGVRTQTDDAVFTDYQARLRQEQIQFCQGMDMLARTREIGGSIEGRNRYATGMMVFFTSAMEHARRNGLKTPTVSVDDARTVILQDGASVLGDQQLTNLTLLRMFDLTRPDLGSAEHEAEMLVFDADAEHNRATLNRLAETMQTALTTKVSIFEEQEAVFVDLVSRRYPTELITDIMAGAADCKHLLQNALHRERLIAS